MSVVRALPLFSAVFAPLYAAAMYFNIAMFVYYPQPNELHWHDQPNLPGPAMYWYGWIAYAGLGAAIVLGLASFLPERFVAQVSPHGSWIAPLASILFILYVIREWFIH